MDVESPITFDRKIPLLNALDCNDLSNEMKSIRFRGMIQDIHNPEYYFESFEVVDKVTKESRISSGKYLETADIGESEYANYNSPHLKAASRLPMSVITIPALNSWVKAAEKKANDFSPEIIDSDNRSNKNLKRGYEDCDEEDDVKNVNTKLKEKKIEIPEELNKSSTFLSKEHILNFPLPDATGKVAIVKIYDDTEKLKLNDMIEVVGHLRLENPAIQEQSDDGIDLEGLTLNPPPSLVPRIHAVQVRKLNHCNPILDYEYDIEKHITNIKQAREDLHKVLTQILLGDQLAADYLICNLLSRVYIRRDLLTIGNFPLNLFKVPIDHAKYTKQLYDIIEKIITKSHYLEMSIENLNDLAFVPKKDYDCNRLTSGILQLTANTHLILDETKMEPGKLNAAGVSNLSALKNAMQEQKINYNFKYYNIDFHCDIPFLVLSEGHSLLKPEFSLPLEADESSLQIIDETFEAANHFLNEEVLNRIRMYITYMQMANYQISEEPQFVQEDFVNMKNNTSDREINENDLHRLLVLTRLICLSKGITTLDKECWSIAKDMEERRFNRLKNLKIVMVH